MRRGRGWIDCGGDWWGLPLLVEPGLVGDAVEPGGVVVGVDVGGTKTRAAVFDRHFDVIDDVTVPTLVGGPRRVQEGIVSTVAGLRLGGRELAGVGVGIPGIVDGSAGTVRHAFNLGVGGDVLEVASGVGAAVGAPCWVANDVDAAALGVYEVVRRGRRRLGDLAYLSVGTGVAAGVVLGGRIYAGSNGFAGEIGHLRVDPDGQRCLCGMQGCLEAVASGPALARRWCASGRQSPVEALFAAAGRGEGPAALIVERAAAHLAHAVHALALTFDVDRIVIGGGVADVGGPLLVDAIAHALRRVQSGSPWMEALGLPGRIMLKPPEPVGVIGAAALTARGGAP